LDPPPIEIDQEVVMADDASADGVGEVAVGASEHRLDPAQELAQPEWLGEVVVGPELQADDLVDLFIPGREHEDGRLRAGRAEPPQDLEAVHARQADVEEDQVGSGGGGQLEAFLAGPRERDLVALLLEGVLEPARDGVLVFDDQDRGCHLPTKRTPGAARPPTRACVAPPLVRNSWRRGSLPARSFLPGGPTSACPLPAPSSPRRAAP